MASEDALTDFIQTLGNLPSEINHILSEVTVRDNKINELTGRIQGRDLSIQKHHKTAGLHVDNPKEAQGIIKCRQELQRIEALTDDKIALAQRAAKLLQRHLAKSQIELGKLQGAPAPNIAARFGMRLPPEQLAQAAYSPAPLPSAGLLDPNKRRKLGMDTGAMRAASPITSAISRASPSVLPSSAASLHVPMSASSRKRKTPTVPEEDEDDAEGEDDATGSEDAEGDFLEQEGEGESEMPAGDDAPYCICQKVSYGEMVGCDNAACQYEWFHLGCVGLKEPPKGKWYCPDCSGGVARLPANPPAPAQSSQQRQRGNRR